MIAAIELGILAVLKAAGDADVLGYKYVERDTFPDEFEQYLESVPNLRTPAAWVAFLGMDQFQDAGDDSGPSARLRYALVVGTQNLRNEQQTRHGDGGQPGSYQLAIDAIALLSDNDLSAVNEDIALQKAISVTGGRLVNRTPQMKKQALSLVAIELECRAVFGSFTSGNPGDFKSFHADWDIPAHGNVALPLPSASPDASDLVEVPQ
ncbi:phage protein Gp37 [Novosphingobium naphthalenivorans]|uniref:phage protein Gp37 n=1 Tax=Novosphingobium naphthalenivorans TaxID=273168 RepID=UPI00082ACA8D|nr:phage protein Gp37 [Novosphingobium naphthalenivorans]